MIQTKDDLQGQKDHLESRNPVFALEMIQTSHEKGKKDQSYSLSQSSIRHGDDSDSYAGNGF